MRCSQLVTEACMLLYLQITAFGFLFEKVVGVHEKPFWVRCLARTPLCKCGVLDLPACNCLDCTASAPVCMRLRETK